jgi:transposase
LATLVLRTCAVRQEPEAWGQQQSALPLLVEKPGRTKDGVCRRWHGQSVMRQVEVEDSEGQVTQAVLRFVVVQASPLAQQQAQTAAATQAKEAAALADHSKHVEAWQFACLADAEAALAEYEGRGQGRRGRRPRPWRYHTVHYRIISATRRTRRARRERPAKTDPPPVEACYRLVVEVEAVVIAEEENGWTVLATTVSAECGSDRAILQAYQEQNTTVEPGFRWIKNPATITPVWIEKPERIAALATLTVVGLLVYSVIQRQVSLYLRTHDQQLPGNKEGTATPTAAVVLSLFAQVTLVHFWVGDQEVEQVYGI